MSNRDQSTPALYQVPKKAQTSRRLPSDAHSVMRADVGDVLGGERALVDEQASHVEPLEGRAAVEPDEYWVG